MSELMRHFYVNVAHREIDQSREGQTISPQCVQDKFSDDYACE